MGRDASAVDGAGDTTAVRSRSSTSRSVWVFLSCDGPVLTWKEISTRCTWPWAIQSGADVLGPPSRPPSPLGNVTNVRKRRRLNVDFEELKKAGVGESTVLADEVWMMEVRIISFGIADVRKCKTRRGYVFVYIGGELKLIFTGTNMTP